VTKNAEEIRRGARLFSASEVLSWENDRDERVRQHPFRALRHVPIRLVQADEPERSPAMTIAWARPLCANRNAVQRITRSAACR